MAYSIHQCANFPKNLTISTTSLEVLEGQQHLQEQTWIRNDYQEFGIAAKTWDASFALLDYLLPQPHHHHHHHHHPIQYEPASPLLNTALESTNIHIIDLGSGTCHLATELLQRLDSCAKFNISITVTDLPEVLPLLERNISSLKLKDPRHTISGRALTWGSTQETIAVLNSLPSRVNHAPSSENTDLLLITCSDLVFFPFLFIPLLRTLLILTAPPPQLLNATSNDGAPFAPPVVVLFGYKQRCAVKEFPFFELLGRYFKLEPILSRRKSTDPWELTRHTTKNTHNEEEEDHGGSNLIYLLRATRHSSTNNKQLDQLVLDSLLSKTPADQETPINTTEQQDPLFTLGDASAADQWEWILLSNLSDHHLFS
ncbi:hypothetical protein PCANC_04627 [Puccinia coronata f. sp. avenae]|uniref:Methyltransferase domain-containing protein n=1 Tax=Puccinia coronata f. sp. avenae TaxID=200324 RepID=A0A2N5W0A6_9BASI|nr:hypothetical protein PCASD_16257 [Puccinia coronata f. sp. avenae]PLW55666.1 hypothetical protein PCANC_04627 [Puccinia coronata f. sp. avenae]